MSQDTNVKELVINQLTKEQYNKLKKENKLSKSELYIITDDEHYTNEEIVNLLKTKQNVLTAGDNIIIKNNTISANLTRYSKNINTLCGYNENDILINLKELPNIKLSDSVDKSYPSNYLFLNDELYYLGKNNSLSKISRILKDRPYAQVSGGYNSLYTNSSAMILNSLGGLSVVGASSSSDIPLFKTICGDIDTEYKHLGLGIGKSDNKLYSIYKEDKTIICNKISDINTWTKITGFVQNYPSYGYVANAYGIADDKLYEIKCNTNLECEAVLIDEESGWTNISGLSRDKYFSCIGIKNGKIYIINNGTIKLVNLNEDCSNAILCQQCGEKAFFINNKKLYIVYLNVTDNILTPIKYFDDKEVYTYNLYYNDWVSMSVVYHISNTDDSNNRYLYSNTTLVNEVSTLNNIDKIYGISNYSSDNNKKVNVCFVTKPLFYTKNETDEQYKKLIAKIDYDKDKLYIYNYYNEEIAQVDVKISTDNTTVNYNDNNELQSIGEITKNGLVKHTWIGTQEEYENDLQSGIIDENTEVLINDSVAEIITPQVEFNAPTKLSELANDMNFVDNTSLDNKVSEINAEINSKANDIGVVHVTGNEDIDGTKTFLNEINIKTGSEYTKIGHKNSTSDTPNLQDGYIKFGKDTLKFGEQNIQGETYNVENDIFHSGNLTGGDGITIDLEDKSYKVNIDKTKVLGNSVTLGSDAGVTTITGGSASSSSKMVLNASPSSGSGDITISRTSDKINVSNTYIDTMSIVNTTNHMLIGTNNTAKNTYVKTNKLYRYNNKSTYEVLDENNFNKILTAGEGIKLENNTISSTVQGVPIGTVYPCLCTADYVPSGALPCDGTEYTKEQFTDLWDNFLTAETPLLPTCTYKEYQTAISTYGSCAKFGVTETTKNLNPDYTYVGDLNVDGEGIASNLSSDTYATVPVSFTLTPTTNFYYKIRVKLYKNTGSAGARRCITAFYHDDIFNINDFELAYMGDNGSMNFFFYLEKDDDDSTSAGGIYVNNYFNEGDWVTVEYIKTGTTFTIKVTNDLGETHEGTTENISVKTNTYTLARVGKSNDGAADYYKSDIDLSSVLIKIDDVEIFNGYDSEGSSKFKVPTIKPNRTLIYSGTGSYTTYRLYSDGFCEQWGKLTASANGATTATFDWSYKNTDYYLDCAGYSADSAAPEGNFNVQNSAYWNKTTTGFTCYGLTSRPKPFYACGYVNTSSSVFQDYFNNAEINRYFVQVSNGTISDSAMDWSAWASGLQGKANTDLDNLSDTGKKVIDGQWVHSYLLANTTATKGVYSISLSDYLPDNTYWYEISATLNIYTSSSSGTNGNTEIANYLGSNQVTHQYVGDSRNFFYVHAEYDDANENIDNTFTMIIPPNNQTIYKSIWGTNGTRNDLHLIAYRRLGTNE